MDIGPLVSALSSVAVVLIIALGLNLPGVLKKRGEVKVQVEEQHTEQKRLDLETAKENRLRAEAELKKARLLGGERTVSISNDQPTDV